MPDARLVHVIDDDEDVRESLAFLLESAGFAVETYDSGTRFLESGAHESGCVVTDVRMPGLDGLELAVRLKARGSPLPVIVITGHADVPLAVEAMRSGVQDFIEKPFDDVTLITAIETALSRPQAPQGDRHQRLETLQRMESLSGRERQVLQALVGGQSNKAMARDLGISPRTVEIYRAKVMTKMGAESLSQLVRMSILAAFDA
ncbi:MAG TPA: response regulator FixJ [Burkholderiales bacterium]|jgi:two-component system response regulator FixJ